MHFCRQKLHFLEFSWPWDTCTNKIIMPPLHVLHVIAHCMGCPVRMLQWRWFDDFGSLLILCIFWQKLSRFPKPFLLFSLSLSGYSTHFTMSILSHGIKDRQISQQSTAAVLQLLHTIDIQEITNMNITHLPSNLCTIKCHHHPQLIYQSHQPLIMNSTTPPSHFRVWLSCNHHIQAVLMWREKK